MRRIPRPQRAIDPSLPISPLIQRRLPLPSCLRATLPPPQLRTTSACFSTTPTFNFLFGGKQDKKKHQAFVRRWQKRMLGDSEPIGSHVDPYDPNSPVRIAPEEQGEEVEVLEDGGHKPKDPARSNLSKADRKKSQRERRVTGKKYKEATCGPLLHVGGNEWIERRDEVELAKEFEKLTMRTYTPMTQSMADEIEEWTGSFYTLRDQNLMMAQTFDEATGKPYTSDSFGRYTPIKNVERLRNSFHQAVVEIHALKQAKQADLDMSKQSNRGVYEVPEWIKDVKLQRNDDGEFVLAFPPQQSLDKLLKEMRHVPEYTPPVSETIVEKAVEEEMLAEEGQSFTPEVVEPPPTMDPATPAFKRAALVKDDEDKPKFDFMSNRPVPRAVPVEPAKPAEPVEPVTEVAEEVQEFVVKEPVTVVEPTPSAPAIDLDAALANTTSIIGELRHSVLESAARSAEKEVSSLRDALRDGVTSISNESILRVEKPEGEAKWQHVPLTDLHFKFALSKRFAQLTGQYISDPQLTSSKTIGDLYHHVIGTVRAAPSDVYTFINVEGARQNQKAKWFASLSKKQPDAPILQTRFRTGAGELLKASNVELRKRKVNKSERRVQIGLEKAVKRELRRKGLVGVPGAKADREMASQNRQVKDMQKVFGEFRYN